MKNLFLLFSLLLFGGFLFVGCSQSDGVEETEGHKDLPTLIDEYLEEHQPDNAPGLSVIIMQNGQIIYRANKGIAQISTASLIDQHTQFRTASVSKPITAVAIMMLVERGLITLEDKVIDLLSRLPDSFSEITIKQLLSHRAGLFDYIDDNTNRMDLNNMTNEDLLNIIQGSGLDNLQFSPGSSGDYSNTGYALLASIIEEVSGKSYPEFLKSEVFTPLGMTNSFVIDQDQQMGDKGENFALAFGNTPLVFGFNSLIYGANGVVSSTNDLSLFTKALLNGDIISEASLSLMTQTQGSLPEIADYGLGWMTGKGIYWHSDRYSSKNDFWHTGGYDGYRTLLSINPDLDLQVIILTNNGEDTQQQMFDILELGRKFFM